LYGRPSPGARAGGLSDRRRSSVLGNKHPDQRYNLRDTTGARHALGRVVFHGKRGELRQPYRESQEDQLGALGLVLNAIVLWNTRYMDAALRHLRAGGVQVLEEDLERLSPLVHAHINMLGRYHFTGSRGGAQIQRRPPAPCATRTIRTRS